MLGLGFPGTTWDLIVVAITAIVWLGAGAAIFAFTIAAAFFHLNGDSTMKRYCGIGWLVAAAIFLIPVAVGGCK
jgi:hypothetical protein